MKKYLIIGGVLIGVVLGLMKLAKATDEAFEASMNIFAAIQITETQALIFPTQIAGDSGIITVAPTASGAATFTVTGQSDSSITASVVESTIDMVRTTPPNNTIAVGTFQVDPTSPTFDGSGQLPADIRVGASTESLLGTELDGIYVGTATFQVIYQ